eukprot:Sro13_g010170.2  (4082) ;mRNA; r:131475-143808
MHSYTPPTRHRHHEVKKEHQQPYRAPSNLQRPYRTPTKTGTTTSSPPPDPTVFASPYSPINSSASSPTRHLLSRSKFRRGQHNATVVTTPSKQPLLACVSPSEKGDSPPSFDIAASSKRKQSGGRARRFQNGLAGIAGQRKTNSARYNDLESPDKPQVEPDPIFELSMNNPTRLTRTSGTITITPANKSTGTGTGTGTKPKKPRTFVKTLKKLAKKVVGGGSSKQAASSRNHPKGTDTKPVTPAGGAPGIFTPPTAILSPSPETIAHCDIAEPDTPENETSENRFPNFLQHPYHYSPHNTDTEGNDTISTSCNKQSYNPQPPDNINTNRNNPQMPSAFSFRHHVEDVQDVESQSSGEGGSALSSMSRSTNNHPPNSPLRKALFAETPRIHLIRPPENIVLHDYHEADPPLSTDPKATEDKGISIVGLATEEFRQSDAAAAADVWPDDESQQPKSQQPAEEQVAHDDDTKRYSQDLMAQQEPLPKGVVTSEALEFALEQHERELERQAEELIQSIAAMQKDEEERHSFSPAQGDHYRNNDNNTDGVIFLTHTIPKPTDVTSSFGWDDDKDSRIMDVEQSIEVDSIQSDDFEGGPAKVDPVIQERNTPAAVTEERDPDRTESIHDAASETEASRSQGTNSMDTEKRDNVVGYTAFVDEHGDEKVELSIGAKRTEGNHAVQQLSGHPSDDDQSTAGTYMRLWEGIKDNDASNVMTSETDTNRDPATACDDKPPLSRNHRVTSSILDLKPGSTRNRYVEAAKAARKPVAAEVSEHAEGKLSGDNVEPRNCGGKMKMGSLVDEAAVAQVVTDDETSAADDLDATTRGDTASVANTNLSERDRISHHVSHALMDADSTDSSVSATVRIPQPNVFLMDSMTADGYATDATVPIAQPNVAVMDSMTIDGYGTDAAVAIPQPNISVMDSITADGYATDATGNAIVEEDDGIADAREDSMVAVMTVDDANATDAATTAGYSASVRSTDATVGQNADAITIDTSYAVVGHTAPQGSSWGERRHRRSQRRMLRDAQYRRIQSTEPQGANSSVGPITGLGTSSPPVDGASFISFLKAKQRMNPTEHENLETEVATARQSRAQLPEQVQCNYDVLEKAAGGDACTDSHPNTETGQNWCAEQADIGETGATVSAPPVEPTGYSPVAKLRDLFERKKVEPSSPAREGAMLGCTSLSTPQSVPIPRGDGSSQLGSKHVDNKMELETMRGFHSSSPAFPSRSHRVSKPDRRLFSLNNDTSIFQSSPSSATPTGNTRKSYYQGGLTGTNERTYTGGGTQRGGGIRGHAKSSTKKKLDFLPVGSNRAVLMNNFDSPSAGSRQVLFGQTTGVSPHSTSPSRLNGSSLMEEDPPEVGVDEDVGGKHQESSMPCSERNVADSEATSLMELSPNGDNGRFPAMEDMPVESSTEMLPKNQSSQKNVGSIPADDRVASAGDEAYIRSRREDSQLEVGKQVLLPINGNRTKPVRGIVQEMIAAYQKEAKHSIPGDDTSTTIGQSRDASEDGKVRKQTVPNADKSQRVPVESTMVQTQALNDEKETTHKAKQLSPVRKEKRHVDSGFETSRYDRCQEENGPNKTSSHIMSPDSGSPAAPKGIVDKATQPSLPAFLNAGGSMGSDGLAKEILSVDLEMPPEPHRDTSIFENNNSVVPCETSSEDGVSVEQEFGVALFSNFSDDHVPEREKILDEFFGPFDASDSDDNSGRAAAKLLHSTSREHEAKEAREWDEVLEDILDKIVPANLTATATGLLNDRSGQSVGALSVAGSQHRSVPTTIVIDVGSQIHRVVPALGGNGCAPVEGTRVNDNMHIKPMASPSPGSESGIMELAELLSLPELVASVVGNNQIQDAASNDSISSVQPSCPGAASSTDEPDVQPSEASPESPALNILPDRDDSTQNELGPLQSIDLQLRDQPEQPALPKESDVSTSSHDKQHDKYSDLHTQHPCPIENDRMGPEMETELIECGSILSLPLDEKSNPSVSSCLYLAGTGMQPGEEHPVEVQTPEDKEESSSHQEEQPHPVEVQTPDGDEESSSHQEEQPYPVEVQTPEDKKESSSHQEEQHHPVEVQTPEDKEESSSHQEEQQHPVEVQTLEEQDASSSNQEEQHHPVEDQTPEEKDASSSHQEEQPHPVELQTPEEKDTSSSHQEGQPPDGDDESSSHQEEQLDEGFQVESPAQGDIKESSSGVPLQPSQEHLIASLASDEESPDPGDSVESNSIFQVQSGEEHLVKAPSPDEESQAFNIMDELSSGALFAPDEGCAISIMAPRECGKTTLAPDGTEESISSQNMEPDEVLPNEERPIHLPALDGIGEPSSGLQVPPEGHPMVSLLPDKESQAPDDMDESSCEEQVQPDEENPIALRALDIMEESTYGLPIQSDEGPAINIPAPVECNKSQPPDEIEASNSEVQAQPDKEHNIALPAPLDDTEEAASGLQRHPDEAHPIESRSPDEQVDSSPDFDILPSDGRPSQSLYAEDSDGTSTVSEVESHRGQANQSLHPDVDSYYGAQVELDEEQPSNVLIRSSPVMNGEIDEYNHDGNVQVDGMEAGLEMQAFVEADEPISGWYPDTAPAMNERDEPSSAHPHTHEEKLNNVLPRDSDNESNCAPEVKLIDGQFKGTSEKEELTMQCSQEEVDEYCELLEEQSIKGKLSDVQGGEPEHSAQETTETEGVQSASSQTSSQSDSMAEETPSDADSNRDGNASCDKIKALPDTSSAAAVGHCAVLTDQETVSIVSDQAKFACEESDARGMTTDAAEGAPALSGRVIDEDSDTVQTACDTTTILDTSNHQEAANQTSKINKQESEVGNEACVLLARAMDILGGEESASSVVTDSERETSSSNMRDSAGESQTICDLSFGSAPERAVAPESLDKGETATASQPVGCQSREVTFEEDPSDAFLDRDSDNNAEEKKDAFVPLTTNFQSPSSAEQAVEVASEASETSGIFYDATNVTVLGNWDEYASQYFDCEEAFSSEVAFACDKGAIVETSEGDEFVPDAPQVPVPSKDSEEESVDSTTSQSEKRVSKAGVEVGHTGQHDGHATTIAINAAPNDIDDQDREPHGVVVPDSTCQAASASEYQVEAESGSQPDPMDSEDKFQSSAPMHFSGSNRDDDCGRAIECALHAAADEAIDAESSGPVPAKSDSVESRQSCSKTDFSDCEEEVDVSSSTSKETLNTKGRDREMESSGGFADLNYVSKVVRGALQPDQEEFCLAVQADSAAVVDEASALACVGEATLPDCSGNRGESGQPEHHYKFDQGDRLEGTNAVAAQPDSTAMQTELETEAFSSSGETKAGSATECSVSLEQKAFPGRPDEPLQSFTDRNLSDQVSVVSAKQTDSGQELSRFEQELVRLRERLASTRRKNTVSEQLKPKASCPHYKAGSGAREAADPGRVKELLKSALSKRRSSSRVAGTRISEWESRIEKSTVSTNGSNEVVQKARALIDANRDAACATKKENDSARPFQVTPLEQTECQFSPESSVLPTVSCDNSTSAEKENIFFTDDNWNVHEKKPKTTGTASPCDDYTPAEKENVMITEDNRNENVPETKNTTTPFTAGSSATPERLQVLGQDKNPTSLRRRILSQPDVTIRQLANKANLLAQLTSVSFLDESGSVKSKVSEYESPAKGPHINASQDCEALPIDCRERAEPDATKNTLLLFDPLGDQPILGFDDGDDRDANVSLCSTIKTEDSYIHQCNLSSDQNELDQNDGKMATSFDHIGELGAIGLGPYNLSTIAETKVLDEQNCAVLNRASVFRTKKAEPPEIAKSLLDTTISGDEDDNAQDERTNDVVFDIVIGEDPPADAQISLEPEVEPTEVIDEIDNNNNSILEDSVSCDIPAQGQHEPAVPKQTILEHVVMGNVPEGTFNVVRDLVEGTISSWNLPTTHSNLASKSDPGAQTSSELARAAMPLLAQTLEPQGAKAEGNLKSPELSCNESESVSAQGVEIDSAILEAVSNIKESMDPLAMNACPSDELGASAVPADAGIQGMEDNFAAFMGVPPVVASVPMKPKKGKKGNKKGRIFRDVSDFPTYLTKRSDSFDDLVLERTSKDRYDFWNKPNNASACQNQVSSGPRSFDIDSVSMGCLIKRSKSEH